MTPLTLLRSALSMALLLAATSSHAGDLRVRFVGIEQEAGTLRVALFTSAADFAADKAYAQGRAPARSEGAEVVFADLPPGRYGVSSFHDENENGELDTNFVGVPKEPYGFSNDARGRFGPPGFDEIAFEFGEEDQTLEITLD